MSSSHQYFHLRETHPSTANLIPSSRRSPASNLTGTRSNKIYANFARGPSVRTMNSQASLSDSPYILGSAGSVLPSISNDYSLLPDPAAWGANLSPAEADDFLHNPDPKRDRHSDSEGSVFTYRGLVNLGCILVLALSIITLFAGYPIITFLNRQPLSNLGGFNVGGINASGQIPSFVNQWGLIDIDTPQNVYTIKSYHNSKDDMELVFSDEFNRDGRTFYPGDDPYWEAVDLHYWATNNLEWYAPSAVTTKDGALQITLDRKRTHDLEYEGGMLSSWNKFCFTGGLLLTSVTLPGISNVAGTWPAIWSLGNLARAGYGATLEGMWPYTYDDCDVGTLNNQTQNGLPLAATVSGDPGADGRLSFLPGQRLSRCTCPGESHPGPIHPKTGEFVGRSAPEIDVFEAQVRDGVGEVSLSAQWAPFNEGYAWTNTSENQILQPGVRRNDYMGGVFQQATSAVAATDPNCYQLASGCRSVYGFEYRPGFDDAYISWISNDRLAWTLRSGGVGPDPGVEISARPVPQEPMYLLINLAISKNFGTIDFDHLQFPAVMSIDWVRLYQRKDWKNIGCDPINFPTQAYIDKYKDAYNNPNYTTWVDDFKQPFPKNRLKDQCGE